MPVAAASHSWGSQSTPYKPCMARAGVSGCSPGKTRQGSHGMGNARVIFHGAGSQWMLGYQCGKILLRQARIIAAIHPVPEHSGDCGVLPQQFQREYLRGFPALVKHDRGQKYYPGHGILPVLSWVEFIGPQKRCAGRRDRSAGQILPAVPSYRPANPRLLPYATPAEYRQAGRAPARHRAL